MQFTDDQRRLVAHRIFNAKLVDTLRRAYPTLSADTSDIAFAHAFDALAPIAHGYGLVDELAVASFIHTTWLLGNGFDVRIPVMRQILGNPRLSSRHKVQAMEDFSRLVFRTLHEHAPGVAA